MSSAQDATPSAVDLEAMFTGLRERQRAEPYPDHATRQGLLSSLLAEVRERREDLAAAISADFGPRSRHESLISDVMQVANTIRYLKRNLRAWMQPEPVPLGLVYQPARAEIVPQPLGVVGVISPWNFPLHLALVPGATALAAGNRVMFKPSELTPRTSEALAELLERAVGAAWAGVVTGGPEVGAAFSALPFDRIHFTGSGRVGRLVLQAAAENLTPVTLELGGKSPVLVHPDFPPSRAAELVAFGKLHNAGQICVAPDYVLVRRDQADRLAAEIQAAMVAMYPRFIDNPDYTAIISDGHRARLRHLLEDATSKGAVVVRVDPAGEDDGESHKMLPAIVRGVTPDMAILQEEIFGPLLPIVEVDDWDAMIVHVNGGDRPLTMYVMDRDERRIRSVLERTHAGAVAVNETLLPAGIENLPFGGVGASGTGKSRGRDAFDSFCHRKSVLRQSRFNLRRTVAPPFGDLVERLLAWLI